MRVMSSSCRSKSTEAKFSMIRARLDDLGMAGSPFIVCDKVGHTKQMFEG